MLMKKIVKERKVYKFLLKPKLEFKENDQEYLDLLHNRQVRGEVK